jgi:hypothetical protein
VDAIKISLNAPNKAEWKRRSARAGGAGMTAKKAEFDKTKYLMIK